MHARAKAFATHSLDSGRRLAMRKTARGGWTESFSVFVGLYDHAPKRRLLFRVGAKPSAPAFGVFTAICIPELVRH